MKIAMVGTGYVGLVTGTCLAEVGHEVCCVDLDEKKVRQLKDGVSPIFEPGLEDMIRRNIGHERLEFTTTLKDALKDAEVAFIAVGTPEGEDGSADLRYVTAVARSIGQNAPGSMLTIVKSTVPVGTCDKVQAAIAEELQKRGVSFEIAVASNPEFLKEGAAIGDFMKPDRIIVGLRDSLGEETLRRLYKPFIIDDPGRLLVMDRRSSELTKYGANSMLATRISFMNELAQLCEIVGADIDNVRRGMGSEPRIGRKCLYAGPGYGGSCFPKDVAALLKSGQNSGMEFSVLKAVSEANDRQKQWVSDKIVKYYKGDLKGKNLVVWGLAFKPGTDDVREAPAATIIRRLLDAGARVCAHDPKGRDNFASEFGDDPNLTYGDDAYAILQGADALVLVTEWSEYKRPSWKMVGEQMNSRVVFDLRNQYEAEALEEAGFHYQCVGRPDSVVKI